MVKAAGMTRRPAPPTGFPHLDWGSLFPMLAVRLARGLA
jgi:hypothetical protein